MKRLDLFVYAHKGLRSAMFGAASRLAQCDFAVRSEADAALGELRRVAAFLREHAEHEDRTFFPVVAQHNPELATGLHGEHAQIAAHEARLERLLDRFDAAPAAQRPAIGHRLLGQWNRVVAMHLLHMEREEQEANRVLRAHYSDKELDALHKQVLTALAPERLAEWRAMIWPALSDPDRLELQQQAAVQETAS